jgi:ketosteroid isomerase-like protein
MTSVTDFVGEYVRTFNAAVTSGDYSSLLARYTNDAVLRFENVPPDSSTLEFAGRKAFTAAYAENPPDDQIETIGEPVADGDHVVTGFAWRRRQSAGVLDLTVADGLISRMIVIFG